MVDLWRDFWIRETGTGQQVAQLHDRYMMMMMMMMMLIMINDQSSLIGKIGYYLFTYSMVQSPSWEANWFAASQETLRILWNPKVHYSTHKRLPPVPILGQPNPVHIPTSHLLEIHPNIIHLSTPRSPQWSLPFWFPHQDPIHPPLLTHTCHMPSPSNSSRFYHPHNIGWGVQII